MSKTYKQARLGRLNGGCHYVLIPADMVRNAQLEKGSAIRIHQNGKREIVIDKAVGG
jgi:antitoxin component of MazEF toxin-antitoxin module